LELTATTSLNRLNGASNFSLQIVAAAAKFRVGDAALAALASEEDSEQDSGNRLRSTFDFTSIGIYRFAL
jgi:hypothetical protein